jgi:hypothetical protein
MRRRDIVLGFCAGLVIALVVAVVFLSSHALPRATAQEARASAPRYEFKVWAYPGSSGERGPFPPSHGAYVLDTATGKLWQTTDGGNLKPVAE